MISITYRTDGPWGPGKGANLSPREADENFWNAAQGIQAILDNPDAAVQITAITYTAGGLNFLMSDGSTIGPVPVPVVTFYFRGEWTPNTSYAVLDTFTVSGVGLFLVLQPHVSDPTFDPNRQIGGNPVYQIMLPMDVPGTLYLSQLADTAITSPQPGDVLRFDGTNWVNAQKPYIIATNFNGVLADGQDLLHHLVARSLSFPANFAAVDTAQSGAAAIGRPTAAVVVHVAVCAAASDPTNDANYTEIGTLSFAAGAAAATLATTSGTIYSLGPGDMLRIRGPATHDPTFAGIVVTLVGVEG
jgi:hypothetical protein